MIRSLVCAGATVKLRTEAVKTALDFAIETDRAEIVETLERAGGESGKGR